MSMSTERSKLVTQRSLRSNLRTFVGKRSNLRQIRDVTMYRMYVDVIKINAG